MNAYAERFVLSIKSECLRKVIPLGETHLRSLVSEYVEHYHEDRNHQGIGILIPFPQGQPAIARTAVRRRERVGGILSYRAPRRTMPRPPCVRAPGNTK